MTSIIKATLQRFSVEEVQEKYQQMLLGLEQEISLTEDLTGKDEALVCIKNLQSYQKKISETQNFFAENGVTGYDNGVLENIKNKIIDLATLFKIPPFSFNETFQSMGTVWLFDSETSLIDLTFQQKKDNMKGVGLMFIKNHPTCTQDDLYSYLDTTFSEEDSSLGKYLLVSYRNVAFERNLIPENTFEKFRDFIANTPIDTLMAL